jgi:Flp pilus assembly protein TadG
MIRISHSKIKRVKGILPEDRGTALLEFALSIMVVMFLIFWIWELVMLEYANNVLADAAKEGVRYAIVHGSNAACPSGPNSNTPDCSNCTLTCPDTSAANVTAVVKDYANYSLHNVSSMTVVVHYPSDASGATCSADSSNDPPGLVCVVVTYTYVPYIRLPWGGFHIRTVAEGRIAN